MKNVINSNGKSDSDHFFELWENSKLIWLHKISGVILNNWKIRLDFVHYKKTQEWMKWYVNKILWNSEFKKLVNEGEAHKVKFAELMLKWEDPAQLYGRIWL